jgi:hypothetical protein
MIWWLWLTREGEHSEKILINGDISLATAFRLAWTTWSPGYMNGLYLNDYVVFTSGARNYCYDSHEIMFPGIQLLVKYSK